jgi:Skp family chaperone for outer membrane proteins
MTSRRLFLAAYVATACAALSVVTPAFAQDAGAYKVGVVDLKQVFDNYKKQIDEYAKLRTERDTMQKPIDELSKSITADKDKYDKEKDKMGDDAKRALEEKIEAAVTRYKAEFERAQQDIDRKEKKLMRDLFEEIYMGIQEVGAQGNYHLIFESGDSASVMPGRPGGLLYSSTTLNMTQKVIDHLNGKYKP